MNEFNFLTSRDSKNMNFFVFFATQKKSNARIKLFESYTKTQKEKHNLFASKISQNMKTHGFPLSFKKVEFFHRNYIGQKKQKTKERFIFQPKKFMKHNVFLFLFFVN